VILVEIQAELELVGKYAQAELELAMEKQVDLNLE
jgi:hypothetical protein